MSYIFEPVYSVVVYSAVCILMGTIIAVSLRRSEFGVLLTASELFYLIGLGIYPLLFHFQFIVSTSLTESFVRSSGVPGYGTATHILLYAIGAAAGYFSLVSFKSGLAASWLRIPARLNLSPKRAFYCILIGGLIAYLVYFQIVGFTRAILATTSMRSGIFDALDTDAQYVFIKRLAFLGTLAICFVPALIRAKTLSVSMGCLLAIFSLLHFVNTAGRVVILDLIIVPACIYFYLRRSITAGILFGAMAVWLVPFSVLYGKHLTHYLSALWVGDSAEMIVFGDADSNVQNFLANFSVIWLSVSAGLQHWWEHGPFIGQDTILAFLGVVPSSVFNMLGLEHLSYHNAEVRMPCVNSEPFGVGNCSIPPYLPGYSAYVFPYAGALLFGFLKFFVFSAIERMWLLAKRQCYEWTWFPYFLFVLTWNLLLLVPSTIAMAIFMIILFVFFYWARLLVVKSAPAYS
jgi:hypothetical protein